MDLMAFHHKEHGHTLLLSQNPGFPLHSSSRALGWPIHRKQAQVGITSQGLPQCLIILQCLHTAIKTNDKLAKVNPAPQYAFYCMRNCRVVNEPTVQRTEHSSEKCT